MGADWLCVAKYAGVGANRFLVRYSWIKCLNTIAGGIILSGMTSFVAKWLSRRTHSVYGARFYFRVLVGILLVQAVYGNYHVKNLSVQENDALKYERRCCRVISIKVSKIMLSIMPD